MRIWITDTGFHTVPEAVRCVEAEQFDGINCVRFQVPHSGGIDYYTLGRTCELTEARAREVVRERAGAERDRLLVRVTELDAALDDETWPPVVRV